MAAEVEAEGQLPDFKMDKPPSPRNPEQESDEPDVFRGTTPDGEANLEKTVGRPPTLRPTPSTLPEKTGANGRKKKVSFAKPEYLLQQEDVKTVRGCLLSMQRGAILTKVRQRGMFTRWFNLTEGMDAICWQSTRKENGMGRIEVSSIHEIRHGRHSELLRGLEVHEPDECIFTIVHSVDFQCMDLIAETPETATTWVMGLQYILHSANPPASSPASKPKPIWESWLEELFVEADTNNDGFLDESEIVRLCLEHNVGLPEDAIRKKFQEADTNREAESRGQLDRDEFRDFYQSLSTRPEIVYLIGQYGNTDVLTPEQLQIFLQTEQHMCDVTIEQCKEIIEEFEPTPMGKQENHFTLDGFTRYLTSPQGDIFNREHVPVNQDMTQPLSHYFISSSHNTFLTQAQNGPCEAMGITRALHRGCRLIDLDVYDGPRQPVVCRDGSSVNNYMEFSVALDTVKEACFKVSQYPMFLRLEVHCNMEQQKMMVEMLQSKLSPYLYDGEIDGEKLPSPSSCLRTIFLIGKKLKGAAVAETDGTASEEEDETLSNPETPDQQLPRRLSRANSVSTIQSGTLPAVASSTGAIMLLKELSNLINFNSSADKGLADSPFERYDGKVVTSICEPRVNHYSLSKSSRLMHRTKSSLMRAYPATTRAESSNMDPMVAWSRGVQFAALNCQTIGKAMDMNEGLFKANGYSGYYLKPAAMRDDCGYFTYMQGRPQIPGVNPVDLVVKVISGQMLPKPSNTENRTEVIDPYVTIELDGLDCDRTSQRTRPVENNGFNPVWDESFSFHVRYPEMTMVRFTVLDADAIGSDFIGQFCIPLASLKPGYRHVHLISYVHLPLTNASLFVHVAINKDRTGRSCGITSNRKKTKKEPLVLLPVGVKEVDAHFKKSSPLLCQAATLMYDADLGLSLFKDSCGLSGWTTLRDCIRSLATRARVANVQLSLNISDEIYPSLVIPGDADVPDTVKRAATVLTQALPAIRALQKDAEKVAADLITAHQESIILLMALSSSPLASNEKKAQKAYELYSWNCLTLKSEADELLQSSAEVASSLRRIIQLSNLHGIMVPTPGSESEKQKSSNV